MTRAFALFDAAVFEHKTNVMLGAVIMFGEPLAKAAIRIEGVLLGLRQVGDFARSRLPSYGPLEIEI